MKRIFKLIEEYYLILLLLFIALTIMNQNIFAWVMDTINGVLVINILLSIILFAMGTTVKLDNFVEVFKKPKEILLGLVTQYTIMPLLALLLANLFNLDMALTVGLILVGTVPGGTASDVITFLAKGDLALSVSLTTISTIISPLVTPMITFLLIGNNIRFDTVNMLISIIQIVIIPLILGIILNYKFPKITKKLKEYLPAISSLIICLIVGGVLSTNINSIFTASWIILLVIIVQYCLGILLGMIIGYLAGLEWKQIITITIELAFQNSGLSTSLAKTHFSHYQMATVPGALYSIWQNIAGAILAYYFKKYAKE